MSLFRYNPEIHDHPEFGRDQHGYDPNQRRVPKGHSDGGQWTSGGGRVPLKQLAAHQLDRVVDDSAGPDVRAGASANQYRGDEEALGDKPDASSTKLAFVPPPVIAAAVQATVRAIGIGLALLAARSERNNRDQQAVFQFRSYGHRKEGNDPEGKIDPSAVVMLSPRELREKCQAFDDVQDMVNKAAEAVNARERKEGKRLSNAEYGTAVHKHIKDQIDELNRKGLNRYNLRAEVTFFEGGEKTYGTADAIRVDIHEPRSPRTVCIYDPKTGDESRNIINPKRAYEIARHTMGKPHLNVYVTEVRSTVGRNPPF